MWIVEQKADGVDEDGAGNDVGFAAHDPTCNGCAQGMANKDGLMKPMVVQHIVDGVDHSVGIGDVIDHVHRHKRQLNAEKRPVHVCHVPNQLQIAHQAGTNAVDKHERRLGARSRRRWSAVPII